MKKQVATRSVWQDRGNQLLSARIVIVKIDYDGIVRELRKFKFPQLWTLDDLLPVCGLKTQADRVHLSRSLRRHRIEPVRGKKIMLTDIVSRERIRAYVWWLSSAKQPNFKTDSDLRREYSRQHHFDLLDKAHAMRLGSPIGRPQHVI